MDCSFCFNYFVICENNCFIFKPELLLVCLNDCGNAFSECLSLYNCTL